MTLQDRHLDTSIAFFADGCEGKSSEIRTDEFMESSERFLQSRSVIEDFTSRTLAAIPSDFGRLYYVSSFEDSGDSPEPSGARLAELPRYCWRSVLGCCGILEGEPGFQDDVPGRIAGLPERAVLFQYECATRDFFGAPR